MSSNVGTEGAENVMGSILGDNAVTDFRTSHPASQSQSQLVSSSSYILASDDSVFSRDVDHWIRGSASPADITGVQGSRMPTVQRSTIVSSSSRNNSGIWYLMAMVLPLISVNNCMHWRCTPSMVLNAAELFLTQLANFCDRTRDHVRRLARDQIARDIFATTMDIVLIIYAIGFLVLSMYQASIIG